MLIADGIRTRSAIKCVGDIARDKGIVAATAGSVLDIDQRVTISQATCTGACTVEQINRYTCLLYTSDAADE